MGLLFFKVCYHKHMGQEHHQTETLNKEDFEWFIIRNLLAFAFPSFIMTDVIYLE